MANLTVRTGPPQIVRVERSRAVTISVTPPDKFALSEAIQTIKRHVVQPLESNGELQGLYQISMLGAADKLLAIWKALQFNFVITVLITFLLMAALFESWLYPVVIMVSVPLAAVGGLAGLKVANLFRPAAA